MEKKKGYTYEEVSARVKHYTLFDDIFMREFFKDNISGTEYMLKIILKKDDLVVTRVEIQKQINNFPGRGVCLDVYATDSKGKIYNIEVQRENTGAEPERVRYYSAAIDTNELMKGEDFGALPEKYIIFITQRDVLGHNLPIYTIERIITENGIRYNDREHIIYVNGEYKNDITDLGKLMHDFSCENPSEMFGREMAEKAHYLKETEKGVMSMGGSIEELKEEGREEGKILKAIEIAKALLRDGIPEEKIAEYLDMPIIQIRNIAKEMK